EDLELLCTAACSDSLTRWQNDVASRCTSATFNWHGSVVLAEIEPRHVEERARSGMHARQCSELVFSRITGLAGQRFRQVCHLQPLFRAHLLMVTNIRFNPEACREQDPADNPDICNKEGWSVAEIYPDMKSITRLHPPDLADGQQYCSECFIKMWRQRLQSPTLPDSEFSDYMVEQYEDLQKKCSTTLGYVPYTKTLLLSTPKTTASPTRTVEPTATPVCSGQIVTPDPEQLRTCNEITDTFNVTTGDAMLATGNKFCQFNSTLCLPLPCELDTIYLSPTCEELAKRYSTDSNPVDSTQFLFWNKAIRGSCGSLFNDQRVCK
ncbi:hypothetical protein PG997_009916, partial [Apiospora hydei]